MKGNQEVFFDKLAKLWDKSRRQDDKLFVEFGFSVEVSLDTEEFYFMRGRKVK